MNERTLTETRYGQLTKAGRDFLKEVAYDLDPAGYMPSSYEGRYVEQIAAIEDEAVRRALSATAQLPDFAPISAEGSIWYQPGWEDRGKAIAAQSAVHVASCTDVGCQASWHSRSE